MSLSTLKYVVLIFVFSLSLHTANAETAAVAVPVASSLSGQTIGSSVSLTSGQVGGTSAAAALPVAAAQQNSLTVQPAQPLNQAGLNSSTNAANSSIPQISNHQTDTPLSSTEKALQDDNAGTERGKPQHQQLNQLRQFGYSFFRPGNDSFAPQMDIPVGPDYIVGPGDGIILSAWGSLEGTYSLEVNRSGEIQLPRVGSLKVWGVSYSRLPVLIRSTMAKVFKDFEINVTMGKLKVIKIYVVGEVSNPGDYNISSLSTVLNALSAAGGPLKTGSLRNVAVRRGGQVVETVDLYDFFLKGDKSRDIRLQSGDTIFVPIIGATVGVSGSVKRPAIYELKGENTLKDLLELSGGLLPTGYLQRVQISRVTAHDRKTVNDFNLDPKGAELASEAVAAKIPVRDLDLIKIFPISGVMRDQVRLDGYVLRPGDYAYKPGMRISNLLLPDNTLPEYYREVGEITRLFAPDFHPEKIIFNPAKAVAGDVQHDLELKEFDTVRLFSRWEMEEMPSVKISGEIQKAATYRLFNNMTVRDLIYSAGNLKLTAYQQKAELNRTNRDGTKVSSTILNIDLSKALTGDPAHNLPLQPFDELTVHRIPYWAEETGRYVTISGEVLFPGTYPILVGERLSNIISRAGGFTVKAYPKAAKLTRASVKALQQKQMDESISRIEEQMTQQQASLVSTAASQDELNAAKAGLASMQATLSKMKSLKAEGRMVLRILPPEQLRGLPDDIELEGGDTLYIPPRPAAISVLGKVFNPANPLVRSGESVSYYLAKSGGFTADADSSEIYVVRADGSVESRQQDLWLSSLLGGGLMNKELEPGDTVVVPPRIEKTAWLRDIKDWTTIMSQLAITAGTVLLGLR